MDKTWKSVERRVAAYLGGERVPVTGRQRGSAPDISHPTLSIEVKHRESVPFWLKDALHQAECSKKEGQLPVAIIHEKRMRVEDCVVLIKLRDLLEVEDECRRNKGFDDKGTGVGWKARLEGDLPEIG